MGSCAKKLLVINRQRRTIAVHKQMTGSLQKHSIMIGDSRGALHDPGADQLFNRIAKSEIVVDNVNQQRDQVVGGHHLA
jgi:hypothetical protein